MILEGKWRLCGNLQGSTVQSVEGGKMQGTTLATNIYALFLLGGNRCSSGTFVNRKLMLYLRNSITLAQMINPLVIHPKAEYRVSSIIPNRKYIDIGAEEKSSGNLV